VHCRNNPENQLESTRTKRVEDGTVARILDDGKRKDMITIYGSPKSSSGRCFWCLEEVGVDYEAKSINFKEKEHKSAEFMALNPNGKVPLLTEGDFKIWESMAINFYLAEAHKPELLGKDVQERGLVHQWSFWALADLQTPIIKIFIQLVFVPEERRDAEAIKKAREKLPPLLQTLDSELESKPFLMGEDFSLADLNVHSVVTVCEQIDVDLTDYQNVKGWMGRVESRPAYQSYQALCQ
jgi:glutathione S-transferase